MQMDTKSGKKNMTSNKSLPSFVFKLNAIICMLGIFLLFSIGAFAYDFSDVRVSLVRDLERWQGYASRNKIAILFNDENRELVKKNYNLVAIKKDLSRELLKSFDVADPIIVQEIINTNQLQYQQISSSKSVLGQFADRANSVHVLLVDLDPRSNSLVAEMKLKNRDYATISTVVTEIPKGDQPAPSYQAQPSVPQTSSRSDSSLFDSFDFNFRGKEFLPNQNDSWIYFSPTALVNPQISNIYGALWFKDIGEVDIQLVRFRYELKFLEVLQWGVQGYAIAEKMNSKAGEPNTERETGAHSAYTSLKFLLVDETVVPFNLAVGVRRRIYWDTENTDFTSRDRINKDEDPDGYDKAKDRDEENDRYNALTLQAMLTGKIKNLGLLYNFYLDSQTIGTGAKFLLTEEIKLFADNVYYYYEEPDIRSDLAFGIQFYNPFGSADIQYQYETKQIQLGLSIDF